MENNQSGFKTLAIVPARGGSKGVKRKNLRLLDDKPLFVHVAETAKRVETIDRVILSTDDREIFAVAGEYGIDAPFMRPDELAGDTSQLAQVIHHAFHYFAEKGVEYDAVLSIQPTAPFLSSQALHESIELMRHSGCDSVCSVAEFTHGHPYTAKKMEDEGHLSPFCTVCASNPGASKRRQERERAYYITGGFYLRSKSLLKNEEPKGHWLGEDSRAVCLTEIEAVDINTEFDFTIAEYLCTIKI